MPIYKSIRTALAAAYLGDTKLAKAIFGTPSTFDDRLISLLSGLGQAVDTPANTAISGADIKAALAAVDPISSANRVSALQKIPFFGTERISPYGGLSGFYSANSGAAGVNQNSTYLQAMIHRNSQWSWSVAINSEHAIAGVDSVIHYVLNGSKTLNPLLYAFCESASGLPATQRNPAGTAAYSFPPIPFHPIVVADVLDPEYCFLSITANRAPSQKQIIGNPCDISCNLNFDLTPP